MPTITLQVGQCGNQLGSALWEVLQQQQAHCSSSVLAQELFASVPCEVASDRVLQPRCICVDSEAKVVRHWQGHQQAGAVHMLGHGGGCGNNWSCGYSLARSTGSAGSSSSSSAWLADRSDHNCCVEQVLEGKKARCPGGPSRQGSVYQEGGGRRCTYYLAHPNACCGSTCSLITPAKPAIVLLHAPLVVPLAGIRREAERQSGVPDFLLLASLAGGTGSGFGSALTESLADEYACSTVAAAAVAPGRAGGSDTATQSINCCLALQHLSAYTHVVLLLDNQVLLNQLNACSSKLAASGSTSSSSGHSSGGRNGSGAQLAVSGRACLQGVNELAAQALAGLLWPVGEADQLARRTSIRQLACTVAADPLTKFLEVAHVMQPDSEVNMQGSPWPARIK